MSKKYGLTKREQKLLDKARYHQYKADEIHNKFANSLRNRFTKSTTIHEFEVWDLYTLCESGDSSEFDAEIFWRKVKEEEED